MRSAQPQLPFPRATAPRPKPAKRDLYAGNLEAADLILSDPAKHGGEEAALVRWARLVRALGKVVERRGRDREV